MCTSPTSAGVLAPPSHEVRHDVVGVFAVENGQVVLDAALDQGLDMDHGCRSGSCGACAVEVVAGFESLDPPDPIEADALSRFDLGPTVRLACRMTCRGPLVLRRL